MSDGSESTPSGPAEPDGAQQAERLRQAVLVADPEIVRQALQRLPHHLRQGIAKEVGVPAPVLPRDPNPARFLRRTTNPALFMTLADAIAERCLAATIEVLGDRADDPTTKELRAALDALDGRFPVATVVIMLAVTAAGGAPATPACEEILRDDPRYRLRPPADEPDDIGGPATGDAGDPGPGTGEAPGRHAGDPGPGTGLDHGTGPPAEAPVTAPGSSPAPADLDARRERKARKADKRAQERERRRKEEELARARREQRRRRAPESAGSPGSGEPATAPASNAGSTDPATSTGDPAGSAAGPSPATGAEGPVASTAAGPGGPVAPDRRPPALAPAHRADFRTDDPWVGQIVIAEVEFEPEDPEQPSEGSKRRPCVVIGGSPTHLLVRPGYSRGGLKARDWTSVPLRSWGLVGLDGPTWIEATARRIPRHEATGPIGHLTIEDWNALW